MTTVAQGIEVVAAAFAAIDRDDWAGVADLTAPDIVDRYRAAEIAHLLAWAEYQATRDKTGANGYGSAGVLKPELLARYGHVRIVRVDGSPTIAELAGLSSREFFTRWLHFSHRSNRRPADTPKEAARQIIGAIPEGTNLVHVIYRGVGWIPVPCVLIMPVKLINGRWLLLQNRDVLHTPHLCLDLNAAANESPA